MKQLIYNFFAIWVYVYSYIEIVINYIKSCNKLDFDITHIILVNTISESVNIYNLNDIESNELINQDYQFGIIEKVINEKTCHYIFDELDTNDISNFFRINNFTPIFSAEIYIKDLNISCSLEINSINYFFDNNKIFFREHIVYLLRKMNYNVNLDITYLITFIDYNFNQKTITEDQYLLLHKDNELYTVISI